MPISTHTHAETRRGLEQERIFAEEGVDLSRVVIVHSGDTAVSQEQIDTILIHNPRTVFERHGS